MHRTTPALIVAFACSFALAAPPAKVTHGSDGNSAITYSDTIVIEGYLPEPKEPKEPKPHTKVRCGDCHDGVYSPKTGAKPLPNPGTASVQKSQQQLEQEAKQAFEDAAVLYVRKLRQDEEPLENESMVVKWLLDRAKNRLLPVGPWGTVLDSLEPTKGGISEFDQAKDKEEMKRLRTELEAEERELRRQKEQNEKLYEENMRHLEPKIPQAEIQRGLAALPELNKMQEALIARAKVKSDDYGFVVKQLLSRTRFDAEIRMPALTYQRVAREIWRVTPSNVCVVPGSQRRTCVFNGFRKGKSCFCPSPEGSGLPPEMGTASRFPMASICRRGDVAVDLRRLFPERAECAIPVNVGMNPSVPVWEYLRGEISEK